VVYLIRQQLFELQPAAQATGNQHFRIQFLNFGHQFVSQMNGRFVKFPFEAHNSPHTAAFLFRIKNINAIVLKNVNYGQWHIGEKIVGGATRKIGDFAALFFLGLGIQVLFFSPLRETLSGEGWDLPLLMNVGCLFYQIAGGFASKKHIRQLRKRGA
jgi:hypothetical protein